MHTLSYLTLVVAAATLAAAAESALWQGPTGGTRFANGANRLLDFSYAGVHGYEKTSSGTGRPNYYVWPTIDLTPLGGGQDDGPQIQAAVNAAGRDGTLIRLSEGTFTVKSQIKLYNKANIVIRGAGGDKTVLDIPEPLENLIDAGGLYPFEVRGAHASGDKAPFAPLTLSENAPKGTRTLKVTPAVRADITEGTILRLVQTELTDEDKDRSLAFYLRDGRGSKSELWGQTMQDWPFKVTAAERNAQGEIVSITTDRVLQIDAWTVWSASLHAWAPQGEHIGLEHFTMLMSGAGKWMGHQIDPGFNGIEFRMAFNSWVQGVTFVNADTGVHVLSSSHNEFIDLGFKHLDGRVERGVTGHSGIRFVVSSNGNLARNLMFATKFFHDVSVDWYAAANVIADSWGIDLNLDAHRSANYANLFTNINAGACKRAIDGSGSWNRGPNAGIWTTIWYMHCGDKSERINLPKQALLSGLGESWTSPNFVGVRSGDWDSRPDGLKDRWIELQDKDEPDSLESKNLFDAQVAARLPDEPIPVFGTIFDFEDGVQGWAIDKGASDLAAGESVDFRSADWATSGNNVLHMEFVSTSTNTRAAATVDFADFQDWRGTLSRYLVVDLFHDHVDLASNTSGSLPWVELVVSTGDDFVYHASKYAIPVCHGKTSFVVDLHDSTGWKSEATGFAHTGSIANLNRVRRVSVYVGMADPSLQFNWLEMDSVRLLSSVPTGGRVGDSLISPALCSGNTGNVVNTESRFSDIMETPDLTVLPPELEGNGTAPGEDVGDSINPLLEVCTPQLSACPKYDVINGTKPQKELCGSLSDGCGGSVLCGGCSATHDSCNINTNLCDCVPHTCEQHGWTCGIQDSGCGSTIECGSCQSTDVCDTVLGQCLPSSCTPNVTCGTQTPAWECGQFETVCKENSTISVMINCGTCESGLTCNLLHRCECKPSGQCNVGDCGFKSDGCNDFFDCGRCAGNLLCASNNKCVTTLDLCVGVQCLANAECVSNSGTCTCESGFVESPDGKGCIAATQQVDMGTRGSVVSLALSVVLAVVLMH